MGDGKHRSLFLQIFMKSSKIFRSILKVNSWTKVHQIKKQRFGGLYLHAQMKMALPSNLFKF